MGAHALGYFATGDREGNSPHRCAARSSDDVCRGDALGDGRGLAVAMVWSPRSPRRVPLPGTREAGSTLAQPVGRCGALARSVSTAAPDAVVLAAAHLGRRPRTLTGAGVYVRRSIWGASAA